jgi:hypothetical protein
MIKNGILEVNDEGVIYKDFISKNLINKIKGHKWKKGLGIKGKDIDDIKIDFRNKNIFILVQGEQIYVKLIEIPKVSKRKIYSVIKSELKYHFKNIDNIMFTYDVFKDNGKSLEVIVFCLNWTKDDIVEKCVEKGANIKGIYPIQFYVLNNYKKNIKEHQYIFVFWNANKLYLLGCVDGKVLANSVIRDLKKESFEENIDKFKEKCEAINVMKGIKKVFFLNVPYVNIMEKLSEKYDCSDLGELSKDELEGI